MIRVRSIHRTPHAAEWDRLLLALGAVRAVDEGDWREYDTASGTVAISATVGASALGFVATELPTLLAELQAAGIDAQPTVGRSGAALRVIAASGVSFLVEEGGRPQRAVPGDLAVLQIWYQPDADEMRRVYTALGLRPRIAADDPSGWVDYTAAGGGVSAQHPAAEVGVDATSFEYVGDLDALAETMRAAGFEASVVDEAYNRTLLVASPDGGQVWVNGPQDDLYGYHRAG